MNCIKLNEVMVRLPELKRDMKSLNYSDEEIRRISIEMLKQLDNIQYVFLRNYLMRDAVYVPNMVSNVAPIFRAFKCFKSIIADIYYVIVNTESLTEAIKEVETPNEVSTLNNNAINK